MIAKNLPQRKRVKKRHTMRAKTRKKRGMVIDLDKWARREIVEVRDENICQVCGKVDGNWDEDIKRPTAIQWCHYQTREYYVTRWAHENSFAGCDRCHKWFDNNKVLSFDWYEKKWPERAQMVRRVLQGNCKTTDADIREMWLENCSGGARCQQP